MDLQDNDDNCHSLDNEAVQAVNYIKFGVKEAFVSTKLPKSDTIAYINLNTLENEKYCVKLTFNGYQVVGNDYDTISEDDDMVKSETVDALMNSISPLYVRKFNETLAERLETIK